MIFSHNRKFPRDETNAFFIEILCDQREMIDFDWIILEYLMNRSRIVGKTLCISHCRRVRPNLTDLWRVTDWRQNFRRKIGTIANQGVKQCIRREGSMRRGCDTYQLAKINSADIQRMEFDSGEDPTITNVLCTDDCWLYTVHAKLLSFIFLCCCDVAIAFSIV